ncbi:MAG: hypothetical protein AVDCRST_MAG68-1449, partial [uncultured Gemmatimonadetes bacterium]
APLHRHPRPCPRRVRVGPVGRAGGPAAQLHRDQRGGGARRQPAERVRRGADAAPQLADAAGPHEHAGGLQQRRDRVRGRPAPRHGGGAALHLVDGGGERPPLRRRDGAAALRPGELQRSSGGHHPPRRAL